MSKKNFSPIGPAVWPAIGNIYTNVLFYYIDILKTTIIWPIDVSALNVSWVPRGRDKNNRCLKYILCKTNKKYYEKSTLYECIKLVQHL